jgi:endonuclease/exonuclease/phosphatase family metal-dependent hydrolase
MVNQATYIADALGHYTAHHCKYRVGSFNTFMPIVRKQGNALLAAPRVSGERFHYFDTGIKRLIIELELDDVCVFLVHLSLKFRHRQYQLRALHDLVVQAPKPVIVAGDFNTFWGNHEIFLFMRAAGLRSANTENLSSFPSRMPRVELDFVLVSRDIEVSSFRIPAVTWSDHRPLICDFTVNRKVVEAAS